MGYLPVPTPDMGSFAIEMRTGSVRIYSETDLVGTKNGSFEISLDALPKLEAALQQALRIAASGQEYSWAKRDTSGQWVPVAPVLRDEFISLEEIPAELWVRLVRIDGPLSATPGLRANVLDLLGSAHSADCELVDLVITALIQQQSEDQDVATFLRLLQETVSRADAAYQDRVASAFSQADALDSRG